MFEFKYFEKISNHEKAEARKEPPPLPPFEFTSFGTDTNFRRAVRELTRRTFLVVFWLLRRTFPVLRIGRLVIVSNHKDVCKVLRDSEAFHVPYGPEMRSLTGGADFALGMDGDAHDRQRQVIVDVVDRDGDARRVIARTREVTRSLLDGSGGRIDVMRDLIGRVMMEVCYDYFGLDLEDPNAFMNPTFASSAMLFADPFGKPLWRSQAMSGAIHVCNVIDQAIDGAKRRHDKGQANTNTILDRLVRGYLATGQLSKPEIRSIAFGTVTGLVPTNTLAAAKMLEELIRRPAELERAKTAAKEYETSGDEAWRARLKDILWEAARLNPALSPGQWRYAVKDTEIAGRRVPKDSVLMVSTMSALRDHDAIPSPGTFQAGRKLDPALMFGVGPHACMGTHLAMEQITEIFSLLLSRKNLAVSKDPAGWLSYIGPFPYRLDMVFDTSLAPRTQKMITIQARLRPDVGLGDVQGKIRALGNPAEPGSRIRQALDATRLVHFASLSAFDAADPDDEQAKRDHRVVLELSVDGEAETALRSIAEKAGEDLDPIFRLTVDSDGSLHEVLERHRIELTFYPWATTGLNFNGTPDCPVDDIEMQAKLAKVARAALDDYVKKDGSPGTRALTALRSVRRTVRQDPALAGALIRPVRRRLAIAEWGNPGTTVGWRKLVTTRPAAYVGTLLSLLVLSATAMIFQILDPSADGARCVAYGSLLGVLGMAGWLFFLGDESKESTFRWWAHARLRLARCVVALGAAALLCLVPGLACLNAVVVDGILAASLPSLGWQLRLGLSIAGGLALLWVEYRAALLVADHWPAGRRGRLATFMTLAALAVVVALWLWPTEIRVALSRALDFELLQQALSALGRLLLSLAGGVLTVILVGAAIGAACLGIFRFWERRDAVDERPAGLDAMKAVIEKENEPGYAQNHILAVTPLKKGLVRRLSLAAALWGISLLVRYWYRPGFVLSMGSIHYARWLRLPGSDTLVFLSNYDGSWEAYLEDFITKAHKGQTAAWSNGKGFPRTRYLVLDGARDGSRFKRWVRRQQRPTLFWYCRFPELTTDHIRNNALIHHGLMYATTDTAAAAWLDCFGTLPRPDATIEAEEVQSIVFGGFRGFPYTSCAAISLPDIAVAADKARVHSWLARLGYKVTFGDRELTLTADDEPYADDLDEEQDAEGEDWDGETGREARGGKLPTFVAFSAAGLQRLLGVAEDDPIMASFPPAFRLGMGRREKILRDVGGSAPREWKWADVAAQRADNVSKERAAVDAVLIVYGKTEAQCAAAMDKHRRKLGESFSFLYRIDTKPTEKTRDAALQALREGRKPSEFYEHFRFKDGISQPVIRGTQRSMRDVAPADLVEPGEMILGYLNGAGFTAPAVTMPAVRDKNDDLPMDMPGFASRFPRFGAARSGSSRDFGRNGTFMVIRQLQQHVDRFDEFIKNRAAELNAAHDPEREGKLAALVGCPVDSEWVAAKLMGRKRNGELLLGRSIDASDNDFDFGKDDPQGLHCPFGAHIRRANPRGALQPGDLVEPELAKRHRILRRGRTYESDGEKGLLFVAMCADLERQFEFLMQTWIGSPSFAGLTNEPDPVTMPMETDANPSGTVFTIPTTAGPITLKNLPSFVTVRGGGYFFLPSRSALGFLASWTK